MASPAMLRGVFGTSFQGWPVPDEILELLFQFGFHLWLARPWEIEIRVRLPSSDVAFQRNTPLWIPNDELPRARSAGVPVCFLEPEYVGVTTRRYVRPQELGDRAFDLVSYPDYHHKIHGQPGRNERVVGLACPRTLSMPPVWWYLGKGEFVWLQPKHDYEVAFLDDYAGEHNEWLYDDERVPRVWHTYSLADD